jgi:hypothetical protein
VIELENENSRSFSQCEFPSKKQGENLHLLFHFGLKSTWCGRFHRLEGGAMEWVYVYLTLVKNLPVLSVGEEDYKTEEACINANVGANETFWCVTRNWLDKGQRKPVRAFVTD